MIIRLRNRQLEDVENMDNGLDALVASMRREEI